ncbi:MAG TPA: TetR/AcrR family transcriptional regulator [Ktedonobacterales bacterium]|nr:TetR/AcrR family transcriptional regulator [Ktedonobacterales bacterium]
MTRPMAQNETVDAFLDAAERLLITHGYAGVTARRLAEAAGANHGLIHYYFGSMEQLLVQVLERFTDRLIVRQREMYAADVPFIQKWRAAMGYLDEDFDSGYQKIWLELQGLAWNRPELQERMRQVNGQWRAVLLEAFAKAMEHYHLDPERFPLAAITTLVMTFNEGIFLDRMVGVSTGHAELLAMIDQWLSDLEAASAAEKGTDADASTVSGR